MASDFNKQVIEEFRANGGKVGGYFEGSPLVLLTTTGAKSGNQVTSPVMYLNDGDDRVIVIASNAGADKHPAWYHNLVATPVATAEIGTDTYTAKAEFVEGPDRDALYARMVAQAPGFAEYEAKTTRRIPVVALSLSPA
ncbi:nitroreductase family deazaflavin-dependent oxidoreductase [Nonomuraea sp. NBC_01738]|uniref:nitroreductase family deazaflavin-dependent oxidoreductase n=1 Tax=Nonomuraea sp. NBC_01738 TaxID=2976003 RepID=UPI002E1152BE|nr:nitroreductase family deazaflavin-dependent oxidoreductase [Nonomuraea sp. NBC_01738]